MNPREGPPNIEPDSDAQWAWNVIERSQRGHERKRRLGWRMTEREAAAWSAATGAQVERVDKSADVARFMDRSAHTSTT